MSVSESDRTMDDNINCRKCKEEIEDGTGYQCDGCWDSYHTECGDAIKKDINARNKSKRLQIFCVECLSEDPMRLMYEKVKTMMKYIYKIDHSLQKQIVTNVTFETAISNNATALEQIREHLVSLPDKIQCEFDNLQQGKKHCNYGSDNSSDNDIEQQSHPLDTVHLKRNATKTKTGFICVPKKKQTCEVTRTEIKQKLKKYNDMVNGLRNLNDGAILIECNNNDNTKTIHCEASVAMPEYEMKEIQRKKPKIKIVNISEEFSKEELLEQLRSHNDCISESDEMNVIKIIKKQNNIRRDTFFTTIIETNGELFDKLLRAGHVAIGWERCKVYECVSVQRCYKCLGFNHRSNECKNETTCSKCAGNHNHTNCHAKHQACINCINITNNTNITINTEHNAFSNECFAFQKQIERKRDRIGYTS